MSPPTPSPSSNRAFLLWLGLPLMCWGLYFTAHFIFLFFIGGPVFLFGLALVLASGQPPGRKALAIGFPFVAWMGIVITTWLTAPREQATTFLIPEGFEGTIMVVKNEQCAPPPERIDGRLIYRVPASGLLVVRDTVPNQELSYYNWPNPGYYQRPDNAYYLVDRQGHRLRELTEVHAATDPEGSPAPTSSLFGTGVGRDELAAFYNSPIEQTPGLNGDIGYVFQCVTIATQDSLYQYRRFGRHEPLTLRALADSLLPRCRVRIGQPPQGLWKPKPNPFDSTAHQPLPTLGRPG